MYDVGKWGFLMARFFFRFLLGFWLCLAFSSISFADTMSRLNNSDRPGADYRNFWQSRNDPEVCRRACLADQKCQAWTYVNPGVQGKQSRCYLKERKPLDVHNSCCVSGVRIASSARIAPTVGAFSPNIGLPGGTYQTTTLYKPDPKACQSACLADRKCKAWTYQPRGSSRMTGNLPQCLLKDRVTQAVRAQGKTSGIKTVVSVPAVRAIVPSGSVFRAPPVVRVNPPKPTPRVGSQKPSPTIGSSTQIVSPPGAGTPHTSINPAIAAMFDRRAAERNQAVSQAAAFAATRASALTELRRQSTTNNPTPSTIAQLDCDDGDSSIHPNQNEVCNLKDDNCNGQVDEGVTLTVYRDADGDGFGDPAALTQVCAAGSGLVGMSLNANDCDDSDAGRNPAAGTCR